MPEPAWMPVIGIPCQYNDEGHARRRVPLVSQNVSYVRGIVEAGGVPLLIAPNLDQAMLRRLYAGLDGLMLAGGVDVDPSLYGEEPHPKLGRLDPDRDRVEMTLTRWALDDDLPLFAVCRGIQVLNVAAGGTLYQDIVDQIAGAANHARGDRERDWLAHEVAVSGGTRLSAILESATGWVNSLHHQAVREVAHGFEVTVRSPDGVIEATERPGARFCVAVQWHPEELTALAPMRALFQGFVHAARDGMVSECPK